MQTRQHLEQLDSDLISPGEFDHNFRTYSMNLHPEKIKGHTNSAYRVILTNNKQLRATCNICDRMAKQKIPQISSSNYRKRSRDLAKIKQCIYILDNSWRRREQEQIESIYSRGDQPIYDMKTGEVIGSSYGDLLKIEANHLKAAYDYKKRWRTCLSVVDKLEENIKKYENKQSKTKTSRRTRKTSPKITKATMTRRSKL
tara:strand:- start:315 stop:914 length:600 start_codon:yes stop_codon:yes gene_type:complete